jgi:curved DNA-binding protein CbpA
MNTQSRELINFYLILDIKRNADQDAIEMAYAKAALKHHPDVAGDSPEVQERFSVINDAYYVLSNPDRKREYDQKLGAVGYSYQEEVITGKEGGGADTSDSGSEPSAASAGTPEKRTTAASAPSGNRISQKKLNNMMGQARKMISTGDFWRADSLLRQATAEYPRNADLRRLLAKAAEGKGRFREAVEDLKAAVDIEYFNPENHYLIGRMYLKGDQIKQAEKAFNDALSWQEDYEPAMKGLQKIKEMRRSNLPWWKKLLRMG